MSVLKVFKNGVWETIANPSASTTEIDTTLTVSGKAADAKSVGDAHTEIREQINQLSSDKLSASTLPEAINIALAQAKESGEFKGDTGSQGIPGEKGDKGDTGATGANGKDGTSVTVKSVSESTADGGSNVVTFSDGKTLTVKNGKQGSAGKTPVRGVDYYTEADKAEIVAMVIESLGGNPVFGYVDENNNIIVSVSLPDGTYSVKYEMEDGSKVNIGNLVIDTNVYYTVTNTLTQCTTNNSATKAVQGGSYSATITARSGYELKSIVVKMGGTDISSTAVSGGNIAIANITGNIVITAVATEIQTGPSYTNLLPLAVDASGNDFVGTHEKGGDGYEYGYKLSTSSGNPSATEGVYISGFIPLTDINAIVRIKNITLSGAAYINNIVVYDANKAKVYGAPGTAGAFNIKVTETEGVYSFEVKNWTAGDIAFFRFSCAGISADTIVTVDEEIV